MISNQRLLILLVFLLTSCVYAQQKTKEQIDSLLRIDLINYDTDKSLNHLTYIYNASEKINYNGGKAHSLLAMGEVYMLKNQYRKGIEYFNKVELIPVNNETRYFKIIALKNKAFAFLNLGFFEDSLEMLNESYKLTHFLEGDQRFLTRGSILGLKAALGIEMKMPQDSILKNLKNALSQYENIQNESIKLPQMAEVYINIGDSFLELKEVDSTSYYLQKIKAMKELHPQNEVAFFRLTGQVHNYNNLTDSALCYYHKAFEIAKQHENLFLQRDLFKLMAEVYEKIQDSENFLLYNKKYQNMSDSLIILRKSSIDIASQTIKKNLLDQSKKCVHNLYIIIAASFLCLCLIAYFTFKFFKNYNREKREKELKQAEIDKKGNELKKIKLQVNDSFDEIVQLAIKNNPSFLTRFKEIYPEFYLNLKEIYPELNSEDLHFCALLKLNFSTKDIAKYTFVTVRSVQTRKSRLRKRLQIPSDEDIYLWMDNLG